MEAFCYYLKSVVKDQPVVDGTGLGGLYSFALQWQAEEGDSPSDFPPFFGALTQQLGLSLKASHDFVDVIVIDAASLPTEN